MNKKQLPTLQEVIKDIDSSNYKISREKIEAEILKLFIDRWKNKLRFNINDLAESLFSEEHSPFIEGYILGNFDPILPFIMSLFLQDKISNYTKVDDWLHWIYQVYEIERVNISIKGVFLNTSNWEVSNNWEIVWTITLETLEYKFFEYLIKNKSIAKSHKEIINDINPGQKANLLSTVCSDIKRRLPKELRDLIKAPKWHYLIP